MKVLLYLEGKSVLEKSGIGRALQHQMHALDLAGIPYTTDILGDYDVVHINTYGPRSLLHQRGSQSCQYQRYFLKALPVLSATTPSEAH